MRGKYKQLSRTESNKQTAATNKEANDMRIDFDIHGIYFDKG